MPGEGGSVIALLIGHIAISKSFGHVSNYTIDPSQEFVAIGVTNLLRPFLEGYLATGSFTCTAINTAGDVEPGLGEQSATAPPPTSDQATLSNLSLTWTRR
ncbi:sulfate anion transporter [Penicillium sp. DV-2018c]|nr:sulfate anion transporter [Penicillium sp. DV-2018c]KAJ5572027.1 sulfate anion transporter [Penicillium sp. DV-2018c]